MTDTPPPGAADAARVHGDASALAKLDIRKPASAVPLTPSEADAVFQPRALTSDDSLVVVEASALRPQLTALARWAMHGLGVWLITMGLSQAREASLEPILVGLTMSGGALAWSVIQKNLAAERIRHAAAADPAKVVLR